MGKRIITQRRGRGTLTYTAPSHRYAGELKYRPLDDNEKNGTVYGKVLDIVNSVGHSAPLAKIKYGEKEILIAAPEGMRVNDTVVSGVSAPVSVGNTLPLKSIPEGTLVYNLEINPGDGGKLVRTAGSYARVLSKIGDSILVRLPSKAEKLFSGDSRATIGVIAGGGRKEKPFMKAGKKSHAMRARNKLYPRTSGVAMNAVDHPFGSGRGRHAGKPKTAPRFASPGRNVGMIHARKTGRGK